MKALGMFVATKTKRCSKSVSWMADELVLVLEDHRQLVITGWSTEAGDEAWPLVRLKRNVKSITKAWTREYGAGWKLEIRNVE